MNTFVPEDIKMLLAPLEAEQDEEFQVRKHRETMLEKYGNV